MDHETQITRIGLLGVGKNVILQRRLNRLEFYPTSFKNGSAKSGGRADMGSHSWVVYLGTFIIFGIILGGCITGALAHLFSSWGAHFPNPDSTTFGWYFWRVTYWHGCWFPCLTYFRFRFSA